MASFFSFCSTGLTALTIFQITDPAIYQLMKWRLLLLLLLLLFLGP